MQSDPELYWTCRTSSVSFISIVHLWLQSKSRPSIISAVGLSATIMLIQNFSGGSSSWMLALPCKCSGIPCTLTSFRSAMPCSCAPHSLERSHMSLLRTVVAAPISSHAEDMDCSRKAIQAVCSHGGPSTGGARSLFAC